MSMLDRYAVQMGQRLLKRLPQSAKWEGIRIPSGDSGEIYLSKTGLSKHTLAIGSIGSGKTNGLYHIGKGCGAAVT